MTQYPQETPPLPEYGPPQEPPKPKHTIRTVILVLVGLVVLGAVAVVVVRRDDIASIGKPKEVTVTGTMTVEAGEGSGANVGNACLTEGGYADIRTGTQVTVKDAGGKVIAIGSLGPGTVRAAQTLPKFNAEKGVVEDVSQAVKCGFEFSVAGVPGGESFYSVEVAHRGDVRFSSADIGSPLEMSLGS
jgi:hypothetical protein